RAADRVRRLIVGAQVRVVDLEGGVPCGLDRALPCGEAVGGAQGERSVDEHAGLPDRFQGRVGARDALPGPARVQRVARLALLDLDRDLAGGAVWIDLDERGVDQAVELGDRAAAVRVIADAGHQLRPAACLPEVPGDVGRRAAELFAGW